ncbi:hypothetical protein HU200_045024 [Digitaria exilis]|uniref:RecA-like N-terminal domain-containing protein n=1 Tax=Digitaria exilis TaxID=1010633 RepID=A0A835EAN9_9POAL|nr:hypothetical protein HU200_045024 [Digitaria exilis]
MFNTQCAELGGNAMLVDAEHAFDPAYSKALGVDIENLIVCQPDNGEMALEIADRMCRSGAIDLICIDSVSALTPRAEIEGCVLDCAELMEVVAKKGSWYNWVKAGKRHYSISERPTICDEIEKVVRAMIPEGTRHMSLLAFGQSSSTEDEQVYDEQ